MNLEQTLQLVDTSVEERIRKETENEKAVIQFLFEHDCTLARKLVDKAQELLTQVETDIDDIVSTLKANPLAHQIVPEDENEVKGKEELEVEVEVEVKNGKNYLHSDAAFSGAFLRKVMATRGVSSAQLAKEIGCSYMTITIYMRNNHFLKPRKSGAASRTGGSVYYYDIRKALNF